MRSGGGKAKKKGARPPHREVQKRGRGGGGVTCRKKENKKKVGEECKSNVELARWAWPPSRRKPLAARCEKGGKIVEKAQNTKCR